MKMWYSYFAGKSGNSEAIEQRSLTQLLTDVAGGHKNNRDLTTFLIERDWPKHEIRKRFVHALLKVKVDRADLYPRAREIVEPIYMDGSMGEHF